VARAKRTDRAEARRRYRAQLSAEERAGSDSLDDMTEAGPADGPAPARAQTGRPRPGTTRPNVDTARPAPAGGIRDAFRRAFRPLNLREDIAMLPRLLLHRSFWLPSLIAVITTVAVVAFQGRELISQFASTYFLAPPPIGAIFIAGFMAPRASYLIGAAVGLVTTALLAVAASSLSTVIEGGANPAQVALYSLSISPLSGIFFGAAAAWYRRFLYLASPARQMTRRPPPSRGKPVRGR
jgi:hypothetical protein